MRYKRLFEERYVGKIRRDKWFRMLCPFHKDSSPSLDVDVKQGGYKCWSCHSTGNIQTLVAKLERCTESAANNIISQYMGRVQVSGTLGAEPVLDSITYLDPGSSLELFVPIQDKSYLKYLGTRKISKKLAQEFDAREGSIIKRGWGNRVIFPIYDIFNNLCSLEGRLIVSGEPSKRKWAGGKATAGLFGINKIPLPEYGKPLIIVEGIFDALSIISCGYSAVAMSCSEISNYQMSQLRKVTNCPVIIFDGYTEGKEDTRIQVENRVTEAISRKFPKYEIITIPFEDTDPNDLLIQGNLKRFLKERVKCTK